MKKFENSIQKVNAQVLGLDVHKSLIAYSVLDRRGREIACGKIGGSRAALEDLLAEHVGRRKTHVAFESSGHTLWVYDLLVTRYGEERVHVAQSKKIRAIANSQEKNDANDAFWLAYLTHEGRLPESYVPPHQYRELRIATRERIAAVRRRTHLFQVVRAHLAQLGQPVAGTLHSPKARDAVLAIAATASAERACALEGCLSELAFQDDAIARWDQRIEAIAQQLPAVAAIQANLPGAGIVLAATVVGESGPIERFHSAKAYGRYSGLTPSDRSSGGRTTHGGISREGSAYLRWALTQMAMACTRSRKGSGFAVGEWIRKKEKRLTSKKKARCAAARKLAESIWRLFVYGECFSAAHPFTRGR